MALLVKKLNFLIFVGAQDAYVEFCKFMDMDPAQKKIMAFDIANPKVATHYTTPMHLNVYPMLGAVCRRLF